MNAMVQMISLPTRVLKVPAPTAVSTMLAIWRLDCGRKGEKLEPVKFNLFVAVQFAIAM